MPKINEKDRYGLKEAFPKIKPGKVVSYKLEAKLNDENYLGSRVLNFEQPESSLTQSGRIDMQKLTFGELYPNFTYRAYSYPNLLSEEDSHSIKDKLAERVIESIEIDLSQHPNEKLADLLYGKVKLTLDNGDSVSLDYCERTFPMSFYHQDLKVSALGEGDINYSKVKGTLTDDLLSLIQTMNTKFNPTKTNISIIH